MLRLVTGPTLEPVTLREAKRHLRVEVEDEDELVLGLVRAAREQAENDQDRALVTQTWDLVLDGWPGDGVIRMPKPPLQSVVSVKYLDTNGVEQTLAADQYRVVAGTPGLVTRAYGVSWPAIRTVAASVTVRFVAGYAAPADVPAGTKAAILLMAGWMYERRESVITGTIVADNPAVKALLAADRWGCYP